MATQIHPDAPSVEQTRTVPAPDPGVRELAPRFLEPHSFVLDAGTGIGRNAIHLARLGHRVLAIDSLEEYLDEARESKKSIAEELELEFVNSDITQLSLEEKNFDGIFLNRVLQELASGSDAEKAIGSLQGATREGGSNFVTAFIGTESDKKAMPHRVIFDSGAVEEMYENNGWNIVHQHQEFKKLGFYAGEHICRSYVELVAVKPEE